MFARFQERMPEEKWGRIGYPEDERPRIHGEPLQDKIAALMMQVMNGSQFTGSALCYKALGEGSSRRFVLITLSQTDATVSSLTLIARVHSDATVWSPLRETREPQILPLITFRHSFTVEVPRNSPGNSRMLILTGTRDDIPFRFELSLDGDDKVHLVEDTSIATTNPRSAVSTQHDGEKANQ